MSFASLFFGVGLLVFGAYVVGQPWRRRSAADAEAPATDARQGSQTAGLETQRDATYAALTELESDHQAGKVNDEDYAVVRGQLLAEAVKTLQEIDAVDKLAENEISNRIMRQRRYSPGPRAFAGPTAKPDTVLCPECGKALAADACFCTGCGASLALACPACGRSVRSTDLFCGCCGAALASPAAA